MLQYVAVRCSVLQCVASDVAVCCSVLQCVALLLMSGDMTRSYAWRWLVHRYHTTDPYVWYDFSTVHPIYKSESWIQGEMAKTNGVHLCVCVCHHLKVAYCEGAHDCVHFGFPHKQYWKETIHERIPIEHMIALPLGLPHKQHFLSWRQGGGRRGTNFAAKYDLLLFAAYEGALHAKVCIQ